MPAGRPPIPYTEELGEEICNRLMDGESMSQIGADAKMPSRRTMFKWLIDITDFRTKCARARTAQAEIAHDGMMAIETGVMKGNVDPAAARVVLSSMQWRAAKLAPKKYGDKLIDEDPQQKAVNELVIRIEGGLPKED